MARILLTAEEKRRRNTERYRRWYSKEENRIKAREYTRNWQVANPEKHAERGNRWRAANRERVNELNRARGKRNQTRISEQAYIRTYGITPAERDALFAAQGFACAICGSETPKNKNDRWHTDHDHKTGKVRGVLCGPCNHALGHAYDDPSTLDLMAQYVRHHAR